MCLIFVAYQHHPRYPLVVAANRDELYARPTLPAHYWSDQPGVLAGRDQQAGGTWLGISRSGDFAAVTNFRNPRKNMPDAPTRGHLVTDFLTGGADVAGYAEAVLNRAEQYNGFGLLLLGAAGLAYVSNGVSPERRMLGPGLYGLSNHALDTPWPKVTRGKQAVQRCLDTSASMEELFHIMHSREPAADNELPDTGVGLERERAYSPAFVDMETYGTRCTTVIRVSTEGEVEFSERTYDRHTGGVDTQTFNFRARNLPQPAWSRTSDA